MLDGAVVTHAAFHDKQITIIPGSDDNGIKESTILANGKDFTEAPER